MRWPMGDIRLRERHAYERHTYERHTYEMALVRGKPMGWPVGWPVRVAHL
jgi:hypothetical protein